MEFPKFLQIKFGLKNKNFYEILYLSMKYLSLPYIYLNSCCCFSNFF